MKTELKKLLKNAYCIYSNVQVSAIVITKKNIYKGVNVENAAFGSTICAERSAIVAAISNNDKSFKELHLISSMENYLYPCGACLQFMTEFFTQQVQIFIYSKNHKEVKRHSIKDLLPYGVKKENIQWK